MNPKLNHQFDRHKVTTIKCLRCEEVQAKSKTCVKCKVDFAGYYCEICALYDDDFEKKKIFHCEKCGICRVGGKENTFHCDVCECCLSLTQKNNHLC